MHLPTEFFGTLLQFSISPIALISGAGLILLSITNRQGRTIDRARSLVREIVGGTDAGFKQAHQTQLRILMHRSHLLRHGVLCVTAGIFFSALMILGVFFRIFLGWPLEAAVLAFHILSVLALTASVVYLFRDVSLGLQALHLEVDPYL